jgi:hypothetical protein
MLLLEMRMHLGLGSIFTLHRRRVIVVARGIHWHGAGHSGILVPGVHELLLHAIVLLLLLLLLLRL